MTTSATAAALASVAASSLAGSVNAVEWAGLWHLEP
jgi:hypothetical protein